MASITSVISLFVLLAVSCYSLPVEESFTTSTYGNEGITVSTNVVAEGITVATNFVAEGITVATNLVAESAVNMHLISEDESTSLPIIQKIRTLFEHGTDEVTVSVGEELHENVTFVPRLVNELHENITFAPRMIDELAEQITVASRMNDELDEQITVASETVEEFFPTVESGLAFERRAIRPQNTQLVKESAVVILNGTEFETSTVAEPTEVTSAFTNFAQTTGLLQSNDSEVVSTTEELLTTEFPVESERLIKTVAIIPGQITETKIYPNVPSKTIVVADHVQPLSQVQKQPIVEKEESNH